jgi:hypothetical protein
MDAPKGKPARGKLYCTLYTNMELGFIATDSPKRFEGLLNLNKYMQWVIDRRYSTFNFRDIIDTAEIAKEVYLTPRKLHPPYF